MDWDIQNRSKNCVGCEQIFVESQQYNCLLEFRENELIRKDYCEKCWEENRPREKNPDVIVSCWRGSIKPKPLLQKPDVLPKQTAEGLLRKYLHPREPEQKSLCYILALMLERKKIFIHKDTVAKEGSSNRFLIYEHTRTEEVFVIEDPQLSLYRLETIQQQVTKLLEAEENGEIENPQPSPLTESVT